MQLNDFTRLSPYRWVLEKDKIKTREKMNTDAEIFGTEEILKNAITDKSLEQVINVSTLPEIASNSYAMPDIHFGYGFSIGGVAAFHADSGIVSPGGVGYDINCGVRLIATGIPAEELNQNELNEAMGYSLLSKIPTGTGNKGLIKVNRKQFLDILENGAEEIVKKYASISSENDLRFIESSGHLDFKMSGIISERAFERGQDQVGSLGGGNHFLEIQRVAEIYDEKAAAAFGLKKDHITILIHTGSRGFGHQVATDFIERIRKKNLSKTKLIDPQLIYAPIESQEGQHYLQAMNAAANFAWANRHLIMDHVIKIFEDFFHNSAAKLGIRLVYDQAHNIAKFETHMINGKKQKVLVHRKGATRAFPAGNSEIPEEYRHIGQPVLIPGSMGTSSYVLKGTQAAMDISLGSSAHGAGRNFSRHQALKIAAGHDIREKLKKEKNIFLFSYSQRGLKEEIPEAYKEIDEVIEVTEGAGISEKVAKLIPMIVIKG